ncbi:hypothetical protein V8E54_002166 [Elaphomyces granulatus]
MRCLFRPDSIVVAFLSLIWLWLSNPSAAACSAGTISLIDKIPSCAWCCVEQFINSEYPAGLCSDPQDINCLCTHNTTNGLTLGETALGCLISSCPLNDTASLGVYQICDSVPHALPKTHATITATVIATTSRTVPTPFSPTGASNMSTSPSNILSTSNNIGTTSSNLFPTTSPASQTVGAATFGGTVQTSSSSSPLPSATGAKSPLSTPAVLGISVGGGVSALILSGLLFFCCARRVRQRKLHAQDSDSFEIGGEMAEPPDFTLFPPRNQVVNWQNHGGPNSGPIPQIAPLRPRIRDDPLKETSKKFAVAPDTRTEASGVAISPEADLENSPESQPSQRTLSQLLPDKPNYTLYADARPASGVTVFEEDADQSKSIFGPPLQSLGKGNMMFGQRNPLKTQRRTDYQSSTGQVSDPRAVMYALERVQNSRSAVPHSILPVRNASFETESRNNIQPLQPAKCPPPRERGVPPLPNSVGGNRKIVGRDMGSSQDRYNSSGQRLNSRISIASDTSFESLDADDDDDLQLDWGHNPLRRLSPIREIVAPADGVDRQLPYVSPFNYPKVPQPASNMSEIQINSTSQLAKSYIPPPARQWNSAAPIHSRSQSQPQWVEDVYIVTKSDPVSRTRSASPGSGLLAKRRGDSIADRIENDFKLGREKNLTSRYERGRSRWTIVKQGVGKDRKADLKPPVISDAPKTPPNPTKDQTRRSWQREHNITPTRRGDELFLSVD